MSLFHLFSILCLYALKMQQAKQFLPVLFHLTAFFLKKPFLSYADTLKLHSIQLQGHVPEYCSKTLTDMNGAQGNVSLDELNLFGWFYFFIWHM